MTAISLLTKSNSIRGMSDRPSAYRMTKLALPRFVTGRAGALRVEMETPQQPLLVPVTIVEPNQAELIVTPEPVPAKAMPVLEIPLLPEKPVAPKPAPLEQPVISEPMKASPPPSVGKTWNFRMLARFAPAKASAAPMTQETPRPAPTPGAEKAKAGMWQLLLRRITFRRRVVKVRGVQTELALERVSPIRNDLSDADLEVIPRLDAKKRESNPFRGRAQARRVKEAKEEKNAEAAYVPMCGAMVVKPTD